MKITVKYHIFDLPPGFSDAEFDLSDGAAVSDALEASLELIKRRGATMDENELRTAIVIKSGKWAEPGDQLSDGDSLTIIRPMDGG